MKNVLHLIFEIQLIVMFSMLRIQNNIYNKYVNGENERTM